MANRQATDLMQRNQDGKNLGASPIVTALPGASPLFQLSWLLEVFRYRNQEYGAYQLRQQYPRHMMWGGLLSMALIGLLYGGTLLANALREKMTLMTVYELPEITTPPAKEEPVTPPPPVVAPPPPVRPTIAFLTPKVIDEDELVEEYEPPTQEDLLNKNPGTITTAGDPNGRDYLPEEPIEIEAPPAVIEEEKKQVKQPDFFIVVEQMPAFRGSLNQFLSREIRYPDIAKENGIQGTVVIQFLVNEKGQISNPHILKDIGGGCGEEALRVVRSMPEWLPGKQRGVPVKVQMNLPVKFHLE